jgi:DNA-binding NtrC family response regulator
MTFTADRQPAIALVDDDFHSARLLTRMLAAHDGPQVVHFGEPEPAFAALRTAAAVPPVEGRCLVVVDLKSSSTATHEFLARLRREAPGLLAVAMAPSLDRASRNALLEAGAAAVFERHADLDRYRREAAAIVAFWVRSQHLDAVGT